MDRKAWIYPLVFAAVLVPVLVVALLTFDPRAKAECPAAAPLPAAHTHGTALASAVVGDMQLVFNVSQAAQLFELVDGSLQVCAGDLTDSNLKHITLDVNDARLALGERLPVEVGLVVRRADTGATVLQAGAPAMYSAGHGYHFGDNYLLAPAATYEWEVTVSPVHALRQEGAQDLWREPVTWQGSFSLDADGAVVEAPAAAPVVGEFTQGGVHVTLSVEPPQALYEVNDGTSTAVEIPADSRYFRVDVTDHAVNYEEKIPGAVVTVTFRQADREQVVTLPGVISPRYGYHYGANVALAPGDWAVTVAVGGLDFLRHAGTALSLPRGTISGTFTYTAPAE